MNIPLITPMYTHGFDSDCISQLSSYPEDDGLYNFSPENIMSNDNLTDIFDDRFDRIDQD